MSGLQLARLNSSQVAVLQIDGWCGCLFEVDDFGAMAAIEF